MSTQTIETERSTNRVKAVPDGYHMLTPHLVVKGASEAIEFYKKAFGAEEIGRIPGPDGKTLMHAELKIGDSRLFLVDEWLFFVDEFPEMQCRGPQSVGGTPVTIHMYVEDVDAAFKRAVAAGAQVRMPLEDMFWGDRYGVLGRKKGAIVAFHYLLSRYRTWRKGYGLLKTDLDETAFALAVQSRGVATDKRRKLFFDVYTQEYEND